MVGNNYTEGTVVRKSLNLLAEDSGWIHWLPLQLIESEQLKFLLTLPLGKHNGLGMVMFRDAREPQHIVSRRASSRSSLGLN